MMILQDSVQLDIFKYELVAFIMCNSREPVLEDNKYKIINASYYKKILIVRENSQVELVYKGEGDAITEKVN